MSATAVNSDALPFEKVYEIVKYNKTKYFDNVYRCLLIRSDYLLNIPNNETHAILHYLVVHSAVDLFNKVMAIPNLRINILMTTADKSGKDIRQIAMEKTTKTPADRQISTIINNLIQLDQFIEFGKRGQFTECQAMLEQNDALANQKPPYRRYYLIHHLAYANDRKAFDELNKLCKFDLTLLTTDQQTAAEVAIEQRHNEFANYLESISPEMRAIREQRANQAAAKARQQTRNNEKLEKSLFQLGGTNLLGSFTCPLTKEIFVDPVVLSDGFTYEREAIQQWLNLGKRTSPMTNMTLTSLELVPNATIKQILSDIAEQKKT